MKDRCIVTSCYCPNNAEADARYKGFCDRFEASLDEFGPDADRIVYRNEFPPGSPQHLEMHYAFKFYAVQEAFRRGYRYVMWLDAGSCAIAPIEPLWETIRDLGYALAWGGDDLSPWISDYAVKHFGYSRDQIQKIKLMCGCLIGLDKENPTAMQFYEEWRKICLIPRLMFGVFTKKFQDVHGVMRSIMVSYADESVISEDPSVAGHRSDEACFSLIVDKLGMKPLTYGRWRELCTTY